MADYECPPTPPILPEGEAARTPSPKRHSKESMRPNSPEPTCAICLGNLENMSYTDSCIHKFCFTCLLEWSKVKPECPLCKAKFKSIIHNIQSADVYESYVVPPRVQEVGGAFRLEFLEDMRRFRYVMPERYPIFTLPSLPISAAFGRPSSNFRNGSSQRRRPGVATTESRRDIYRRHMYVDQESVVDLTGRYRETSPEWFRRNPATTHRLVPWLNREMNALLNNAQTNNYYVTQMVLDLIMTHDIRSPEFRDRLAPYLGSRTEHFQHEFYNFARSCYDMVGHDTHATYTERPQNIDTQIISSDSSSDSDVDDILVVEEVRRSGEENRETPPVILEGPSTSRQAGNSHEESPSGDVEIVGFVKPRHLRTPVVVSLSSDEDPAANSVGPAESAQRYVDATIEISDSEAENRSSPTRWSESSEDEPLRKRKRIKGKGKGKKSKKSDHNGENTASATTPSGVASTSSSSHESAASRLHGQDSKDVSESTHPKDRSDRDHRTERRSDQNEKKKRRKRKMRREPHDRHLHFRRESSPDLSDNEESPLAKKVRKSRKSKKGRNRGETSRRDSQNLENELRHRIIQRISRREETLTRSSSSGSETASTPEARSRLLKIKN